MDVFQQLHHGMTIEAVRRVLRGWREALPSAVLSIDKTHLFYTIEFTPPPPATGTPLRLTFDNGKLLIWGEPADPQLDSDDDTAQAG